jgi:hypothetical protein
MPPTHHCLQLEKIQSVGAAADRIEKEIYVGREGRQPITVRLDRAERMLNKVSNISTALVIVSLAGLGSIIIKIIAERIAP